MGIITGALLLTIPIAFILSLCLFLPIAIFSGSFTQYKEVKYASLRESWYEKLLFFFTGRPTTGKWFYREGLPSSFLPRFGILFDNRKGPPVFVLVDQSEPNSVPKWTESSRSGIGRMRAISSDGSNEEAKVALTNKLLGCARSLYIIIDLLRRVGLGIVSGAYSSHGTGQTIFALSITMIQFLYLIILKPFIRRGVHIVESVSLLCEAGIFALSIYIKGLNPLSERIMGIIMLALLFVTFVTQIMSEWYALIKCILRLSQPPKNSFKLGLKYILIGLVLPFLPRKHWSRIISGLDNRKAVLAPIIPPSPEMEFERRDTMVAHVSSATATVVPVLSPSTPGLNTNQTMVSPTSETNLNRQRVGDEKWLKSPKLEPKSDLKKLRELAMASFSGDSKGEEGSTSYAPRRPYFLGEASSSSTGQ